MTLKANSLRIGASIAWEQEKAITGFGSAKQGPDSLAYSAAPSTTTWNNVLLSQFTLAAGANSTVDFSSFADALGTTVAATGILGWLVTATGSTGQLKIEPGASNPLTWFFGGTTPSITLNCGTGGCAILVADGSSCTIDGTHKNVKFSNPGSATVTVTISAVIDG